MEPEHWKTRWREGRIGFHNDEVHRDLVQWQERFLPTRHRVLVPLCGKSLDMTWLAQEGHSVVGVELAARAIEEYFSERKLIPTISDNGTFKTYQAKETTLIEANILELERESVGRIDRVWDRAALVALPPEMRTDYVASIKRLAPGALMLQNFFEYDDSVMQGPPFSVTRAEIAQHYGDDKLEVLTKYDDIGMNPRWRAKGLNRLDVTTALIDLPE